ncbi:aminotransferase class V-fold PLP-dependent enzyme [bacterium SCSIO 12741]|nr:aminotransferase class V-fold PLP-dependent enzyme [bacterium SCSIO 12741]
MKTQKDKFSLDAGVTYLNNAYFAPSLIRCQEVGKHSIERIGNPWQIGKDDFFEPVRMLREKFSEFIGNSDPDRIALIPSASYGLSNAAAQIKLKPSENVVVADGQFPSNIYPWMRITQEAGAELRKVAAPEGINKGENWNQALLDAIDEHTRVVSVAPLMWSDGTLFDLKALRDKSRKNDALLIVDGSQWIGAQPFSIAEIQPDALITAGYKWLLGPYGLGLAYYGEYFDKGIPIEDNWITRKGSDDFRNLINYSGELRPKGQRYSVGEHASLIHLPMLAESLSQVMEWGVDQLSAYTSEMAEQAVELLSDLGNFEDQKYWASHLFGFTLPDHIDPDQLKARLDDQRVYISMRGRALRLSINVFNDRDDLLKLRDALAAEF